MFYLQKTSGILIQYLTSVIIFYLLTIHLIYYSYRDYKLTKSKVVTL